MAIKIENMSCKVGLPWKIVIIVSNLLIDYSTATKKRKCWLISRHGYLLQVGCCMSFREFLSDGLRVQLADILAYVKYATTTYFCTEQLRVGNLVVTMVYTNTGLYLFYLRSVPAF